MSTIGTPEYVRCNVDSLRHFVCQVLTSLDVPSSDATIVADVLVTADLRGVESHGVARLESFYVSRFLSGHLNKRPNISVVREANSSVLIDGDNGLGHPTARVTMERVIDKANRHGAAFGAVRNSNHFGIAGYYAMMALDHDLIGMASTNSVRCGAPTFGTVALLGTNPLAFAIPAGSETPFVLDFATTTVPRGKIEVYDRKNLQLERGWAVDSKGEETTDPKAALIGALLPLGGHGVSHGGHKGYGLGLLVELLTGVLAGGLFGDDLPSNGDGPRDGAISHWFGAFRVDGFREVAEFKADVDRELLTFKNSRRASGQERIYVAGEIEHELTSQNTREGVPIHANVWASLSRLAAARSVAPPLAVTTYDAKRSE